MRKVDYFTSLSLFSGLSVSLSEHFRVSKYAKGDILHYEGDYASCVSFLVSGSVKACKFSGDKEIFLYGLKSDSMVSDYGSEVCLSTVSFLENSVILSIKKDLFESFLLPHIVHKFLCVVSARSKLLNEVIDTTLIHSALQRVVKLLDDDLAFFNSECRKVIASVLNLSAETLSRVLSKLQKYVVIEIRDHIIFIVDEHKLKELFL